MSRSFFLLLLLGCQEYGIVGKDVDLSGLEDSAVPVVVGPESPEDTGDVEEVGEPPPEVPPEEPPPEEPPPPNFDQSAVPLF